MKKEEEQIEDIESEKSFCSISSSETSELKKDISMKTLVESASCPYLLDDEDVVKREKMINQEFPIGLLTFIIVRSRYGEI